MIRYGSVCSGVGTCRLASTPHGWECEFFAEIDPFASAVLASHYPEVPNLGDFTQIGAECGPVDVLVGGTPCQSFSVAGKRAGLDDPRGNLAIEFARLAQRVRARWIVWENVPGVLSSWSDEEITPETYELGDRAGEADWERVWQSGDFDTFLGVLGQCGYQCAWRVLDAQYFGVPQRRRRVVVVGCLGDWRGPAAVLFEPASLSRDLTPRREARERATADVAGCLGGGSGQRGWAPDTDRMTFVPEVAPGQARRDQKGPDSDVTSVALIAHSLRGDGFDASEDGTGRGTPLVPVAFSCKDHGADAGDVAPTLRSMEFDGSHANGGGQVAIAFNPQAAGKQTTLGANEIATSELVANQTPAIAVSLRGREGGATAELGGEVSSALRASQGGGDKPHALAGMQVRRLTPRECERLQGLPDDFTLVRYNGKRAKDGPRYRAVGNGWCRPVFEWVFGRLTRYVEATA